jgi:hypothetical protein
MNKTIKKALWSSKAIELNTALLNCAHNEACRVLTKWQDKYKASSKETDKCLNTYSNNKLAYCLKLRLFSTNKTHQSL